MAATILVVDDEPNIRRMLGALLRRMLQSIREGRTAASQILGRDHYPDCFSL